jgi:hypothetical protein
MKPMLELHLTCGALHASQIPFFVAACEQVGLRPLLIDHDGERKPQPSASAWLRADFEEAKAEAMALAQWLARAGMAVLGVKVDAPVQDCERLGRTGKYFEWRGKLRQLHDLSALQLLCEAHGAQLSRDNLRQEADTCFVTLRSREPLAAFRLRVAALGEQLERDGWPLLKQDSEICLHDSSEKPELPAADWLGPYLRPAL